jgi:hypothetical protein
MNSGGTRGFTVVTIMTLIFAPVFQNHHWTWKLDSVTSESHTEACVVYEPCPAQQVFVNIVKPELPPDPTD